MAVQRPKILRKTELELWGRAAGRCEFRGCNKPLYKDELTQQRSNLSLISHIVAFRPAGPRGDPIRSKQLETDIRNLMLTCRVHGKIIDDKDKEAEYPESLLLEFKREHEQRIEMLTESKEDAQTHLLLLQAPIDGRDVQINPNDAFRAILPRYPAEEKPLLVDLSGLALHAEDESYFRVMTVSIAQHVRPLLRRTPGQSRIKRLSVFALAPIPLLVYLGHELGDIECVDLYQRHRYHQDWTWRMEDEEETGFYEVETPESPDDGHAPLVLLLSVSDPVPRDRVLGTFQEAPRFHELRATQIGRDFLRSRRRIAAFGRETARLLSQMRGCYGQDRVIHVFSALPAPLAIEFGRTIKEFDPPLVLYEYRKRDRTFFVALTINDNSR